MWDGGSGMTLGTGIFASTILLVAVFIAWQLTAHRKWKTFGKFVVAVVAIAGLFGGGLYTWANYEPPPTVLSKLGGISLGASMVDVKLLLGEPATSVVEEPILDGETIATFNYPDGVEVIFRGTDEFDLAASIICNRTYPAALGVTSYDTEAEVIDRLGEPTSVSVRADGLAKTISYAQWQVSFSLSQNRITSVCVHSSPAITYQNELPSIAEQRAAAAAQGELDEQEARRIEAEHQEAMARAAEFQRAEEAEGARVALRNEETMEARRACAAAMRQASSPLPEREIESVCLRTYPFRD
jgi:hypothetical protein